VPPAARRRTAAGFRAFFFCRKFSVRISRGAGNDGLIAL
jgi:hypothetical protein